VRKIQVAPAVDGTTSWIWNHPVYRAFTAEDAGILWVRGKPGSGKSVMARSIQRRLLEASTMEELQIKTTLVGDRFYHRRRGGGFVRHESFVRSVLYHFLQQSPTLFERFFQRSYRSIDPRTAGPWTYDILVDIFKCICQSSILVVCIVDAVDEAESTEVISLIKSVTKQGSCSKARFIVLSRPNVQIERQIHDRPCIVVEDENGKDIQRIIDLGLLSLQKAIHSLDFNTPTSSSHRPNRIARHSNMRQPRYRSPATTVGREKKVISEIRSILTSKAQGSILWVKLVLDKVTQEAYGNEGSTLDELREAVNRISEELVEYYKQIAKELTAQKPPRRTLEIRHALMWICAAGEIGDVTLERL
jgi:hypothetical protein